MKFPNKYLRNLKPYKLASHKIWSVAPENRPEVLKLDWNEATVPPSPLVAERIANLLTEPCFYNLYPKTRNDELVSLLAWYVGLGEDNVQYFASSDALHEYVCKVFISVGDPVIILGPSYDNFRLTCEANGAKVFFSDYGKDFTFDAARFESDISEKEPAVVYICNPNNPTGNLHTETYIEHLLTEFPDTLFLIDEAYYEFAGVTCKNLVLKYDNILISRTMSKAFALANFRVGYLIASADNIQFVNRIRNPKNITTFAQEAAIAALSDTDYMWRYVEMVHEGKAWFEKEVRKHAARFMPFPSHGNFILLRFADRTDRNSLIGYLAENNIFVRETAQNPSLYDCFRITCGTVEQMKRVVSAIDAYYAGK